MPRSASKNELKLGTREDEIVSDGKKDNYSVLTMNKAILFGKVNYRLSL